MQKMSILTFLYSISWPVSVLHMKCKPRLMDYKMAEQMFIVFDRGNSAA